MNKRILLTRIVIRYILLQLPGFILLVLALIFIQKWAAIPVWVFWSIIIIWAAKDIIMFRYTWRAYDWYPKNPLIGARGIAKDNLAPSGYVKLGNELWQAEVPVEIPPIKSGMKIRVKGMRGFTLLVEPEREENSLSDKSV